MKPRRLLILAALAAAGSLFSGCTHPGLARVRPWERGAFTDYRLRPDRDPLHAALMEHAYFSREAASGGRSVGGTGCGCN
jgi:hypothetical protein